MPHHCVIPLERPEARSASAAARQKKSARSPSPGNGRPRAPLPPRQPSAGAAPVFQRNSTAFDGSSPAPRAFLRAFSDRSVLVR